MPNVVDLENIKFALLLAAPGSPEISMNHVIAGRARMVLEKWILPLLGVSIQDIFIDNVLRCMPPVNKLGRNYPTGVTRRNAEYTCSSLWGRWHGGYKPTVAIITLGLETLARDPTPLLLALKDFEKAMAFKARGERPILLCGTEPAEFWCARSGLNAIKERGSYVFETGELAQARERRGLDEKVT